MKKNVSGQVIGAQMVSASDGSAFTGSVTCYVTGDGGTQAAGSVGSGACTHEGNGFHTYTPSQGETNYDHVAFTFVGAGAIPVTIQVYTSHPQSGDAYARLGAPAGASIAADIATVDGVADAIKAVTDQIPDGGAMSSIATASDLATVDGIVDAIKAKTDNLPSDPADASDVAGAISAAVSTILAKLLKYVQLLARKDSAIASDNSTELAEINADEGSGAGSYSNTTDSQEAIRDRGDSAWTGGGGGGGSTDWTDDERTAIRAILGIPGSGTTPADPSAGILDTIRDAALAIKAKTDNLPSDPADASDISSALSGLANTLAQISGYIDTEMADALAAIQDVQSRLPAALTADGNIKADVLRISGSADAADNLEASATTIIQAAVDDAGATTTTFKTTLTETTDDHYNGRIVIFTSGALVGQASDITDYDGTTKAITCTALTEAPDNGATFVIV